MKIDTASQKKQYDSIMMLYDIAERIAGTVENTLVKDRDTHFAIIEPIIGDIADATDVLTEEYINVLDNPSSKPAAKLKIERALRKIFLALEEYRERIAELSGETLATVAGIVNPIMEELAKQVEKIIVIFMQLMELSLDRIMHKHELDEFRRNHEKLFITLPQHTH